MKIIHTSDWHLGQHFYRFDRDDEHQRFVDQLVAIMKEEHPDALVVSGDIFDSALPTVLAQKRFVSTVLTLHSACPSCGIVITAGNHDSGSRLDVYRPVWEEMGVTVMGACQRHDDGTFDANEFIVPISDKGYVVAVPYFYTYNFPMVEVGTAREQRQQAFFQKVMDTVAERNTDNRPVVLMAHLAVEGCDLQGHDDGIVGGMETDDLSKMGSGYDYLALGHIHKPQNINGHVRYSGSPIPLSFSEEYQHSVSVVEMSGHGDVAVVTCKDIKPLRDVMTINVKSVDEALSKLKKVKDADVYVRVLVDQEDILPADVEQRAQQVVEDGSCRLCEVRKEIRKVEHVEEMTFEEIDITNPSSTIKPIDIAKRYYQKKNSAEMSDNLLSMLEKVINEMNNAENE